MEPAKLLKRLRREAAKNPGKAAVLGLLCLVALYFWAPLLAGWFTGSETTGSAAATMAAVSADLPSGEPSATAPGSLTGDASGTAGQEGSGTRHTWQEVARWIDADRRMKPADDLVVRRDPFAFPRAAVVEEKPVEEEEGEAESAVEGATPESLGMALASTIIGPRRRVARIGGKTYAEGEVIEIAKDGRTHAFRLSAVEPRRVVLSRDGEHYELAIPVAGSSGRIERLDAPREP
jgi:hypothetical protein